MSTTEILETPFAVDFTGENQENSPLIDQLSEPIVGKWNVLVSQTNWEKGAIILSWRTELIAAGLPNTAYSDDAWARRVGNVTPPHVGKLRRVAERFGEKHNDFAGLYWSHFNSALDWDDAELWLEGAVQNGWSVAQMRVQRWEALGDAVEQKPNEEDIYISEIDEAVYRQSTPDRIEGRNVEIGTADIDLPSVAVPNVPTPNPVAEPLKKKGQPKNSKTMPTEASGCVPSTGELLMSLKGISEFPADLAEPLELLQVAILNHKLACWKSLPAEQVCRALENLKMLTVAAD
ncbi:MAG: DUF2281 domain-containing protein [Planctomycetaceae bacterium]|jgi:hypothetical protein|nr:DUF2281 domain-containing protein [Planctomycetaceae bacterium]